MATDFNKPVVTDAYATLLPGLVQAHKDLARMLEPTLTGTHTNVPVGTVQWNATTVRWERYNGSSWVTLPAAGNNIYAISISGNAATTTALATARTIGGVSFNGTANINLPGVNIAGNQSTSGNAATATKLATARTIGGVSFDGTANINLPGVNVIGNQSTSGNAATATLATKASALASGGGDGPAMTFNYSGQSGQPTWLWGGNDISNMYVYNPNNFSVSYAATSGAATKLTNDAGSAPSYSCRAWVNFNGTGTPTIRASGNVSSITDNGTGDYTINFTTAMPDDGYAVSGYAVYNASDSGDAAFIGLRTTSGTLMTASSVRVRVQSSNAVLVDPIAMTLTIFR